MVFVCAIVIRRLMTLLGIFFEEVIAHMYIHMHGASNK